MATARLSLKQPKKVRSFDAAGTANTQDCVSKLVSVRSATLNSSSVVDKTERRFNCTKIRPLSTDKKSDAPGPTSSKASGDVKKTSLSNAKERNSSSVNEQPVMPDFTSLWSCGSGKRNLIEPSKSDSSLQGQAADGSSNKPSFWQLWSGNAGRRKASDTELSKSDSSANGSHSEPISLPTKKFRRSPSLKTLQKGKQSLWHSADDEEEAAPEDSVVVPLQKNVTIDTGFGSSISNDGFRKPLPVRNKLKVSKKDKDLFTVVKEVKEMHQSVEAGEDQEITDDLIYILEGIRPDQPLESRCLTAVALAQKCSVASYRMHLRAYEMLKDVFDSMVDCIQSDSLSLACASVMFFLCLDKQVYMEMSHRALKMITELASRKNIKRDRCYADIEQKVASLLQDWNKTSEVRVFFNINHFTINDLAYNCLLSLGCQKMESWFKDAMLNLGGLRCVADQVIQKSAVVVGVDFVSFPMVGNNETLLNDDSCNSQGLNDEQTSQLCALRLLVVSFKVIEGLCYMKYSVQQFLVDFKDNALLRAVSSVLQSSVSSFLTRFANKFGSQEVVCDSDLEDADGVCWSLLHSLFTAIRVLVNLTHSNTDCSAIVGADEQLMSTLLQVVFCVVPCAPVTHQFDLCALSLGLLINLVESCSLNRQRLVKAPLGSALQSKAADAVGLLCGMFSEKYAIVKELELDDSDSEGAEQAEVEGSGHDSGVSVENSQQNAVEHLAGILTRAGRHMDDSFIASYGALLLGVLARHDDAVMRQICLTVRTHDPPLTALVAVLRKFLDFVKLSDTNQTGPHFCDSVESVIRSLECRIDSSA